MSDGTWPHYRFKHNCTRCLYLGSGLVGSEQVDWYICPGHAGGTIVARYGHDGPQYWSMPVCMVTEGGSEYMSAAWSRLQAADARALLARIEGRDT